MPYEIVYVDANGCRELVSVQETFSEAESEALALIAKHITQGGPAYQCFVDAMCERFGIAKGDLSAHAHGVPVSLLLGSPKVQEQGGGMEAVEACLEDDIGVELRSEGFALIWKPCGTDGNESEGLSCGYACASCAIHDGAVVLQYEADFMDSAP